ncbi:oligosaccharide flippase family protein [Patescibacteria group bacterium]|nr:oligosaccharide flippase family protein [Patescibacteria group bacterium]
MENSKGNIGKKAVVGTIYTLTGDYLGYVINFIRGIILARLLAPELFGIFAMADFYQSLFGQPNQIGLDQAVIQRKDKLEEAYNGHLLIKLISAGVSLILAVAAAPILFKFYDHRIVWALYGLMSVVLLQSLSATQTTYLRKHFAFKKISLIQIVSALITFGVSIYLAWAGYGVWALVSVHVVMAVVTLLLQWLASPWRPTRKLDKNVNREMLGFGITIWVGGIFSFVMLQFDDFLVGQFAGILTLGFYAKAYSLAQHPLGLFAQAVNNVAAPLIAEVKNAPEKLEKAMNLMLGLVYKGTVFVGMIFFIWSPQIITLLIGEKWLPAVPFLRGLIIYLLTRPLWDIVGTFLTYTNRPRLFVKGQAVQALGLVLAGTGAVYKFGGAGAALSVSSILFLTTVYYLIKHVGSTVRVDWKNIFILPTLAMMSSGFLSWQLIKLWFNEGIIFWFVLCFLPLTLYVLMLLLLQRRVLVQDVRYLYQKAGLKTTVTPS